MGAVFLRPNLGDMNPTRPARFRGSSLMGPLIHSVDTHDFDYSQPLPPSPPTVNNPTIPSARPCPYLTSPNISPIHRWNSVMWLLSYSFSTRLSMNDVLRILPYGDRDCPVSLEACQCPFRREFPWAIAVCRQGRTADCEKSNRVKEAYTKSGRKRKLAVVGLKTVLCRTHDNRLHSRGNAST